MQLADCSDSRSSLPPSTADLASAGTGGSFSSERPIHTSTTTSLCHREEEFARSFGKSDEVWDRISGDEATGLYSSFDGPVPLSDV